MNEPLEIEIDGYTFHVIVTGWPSRGGATSPPYGAEWHFRCPSDVLATGLTGAASSTGDRLARVKLMSRINDRVQDAVADWADAEDQRR